MIFKSKKIDKVGEKINTFLPVYINRNKLLDINSILFNGYSEFSEETLETEKNQKSNNKAKLETGLGFSIYKLNGSIDTQISTADSNKKKITLKRIQTNSSLLSNTINILKQYKLLKSSKLDELKIGDFITINGIFKNNSICDLLDQIGELYSFAELANKLDSNKSIKSNDLTKIKQQITSLKTAIKKRNANERELVCETDDCIYVVHLLSENIYDSTLDCIYNNELCYFGQVKEITNDYSFFADTQISKFNANVLNDFIEGIKKLITNDAYNIDFQLMSNSNNKITIELDVIAVYRNCVY